MRTRQVERRLQVDGGWPAAWNRQFTIAHETITCETGPKSRSTTTAGRFTVFRMAGSAGWIAVVDDDPSVLKALERALRVRAYQAKTYGSALEFLASLPDGLPECIILDIEMPEMSGLELHHHLILRGIRIPTVLISAQRDLIVRERAESAGVVAILTKPLQRPALFAAVAAALAH